MSVATDFLFGTSLFIFVVFIILFIAITWVVVVEIYVIQIVEIIVLVSFVVFEFVSQLIFLLFVFRGFIFWQHGCSFRRLFAHRFARSHSMLCPLEFASAVAIPFPFHPHHLPFKSGSTPLAMPRKLP
jgi:hypothetical protein